MGIRPIHRIKHVIDSEGGLTVDSQSTTTLAVAQDAPVIANTTEVETGSTINAIYLHVEVSHTSDVGRPNIYLMVVKNQSNDISFPKAYEVGADNAKRFVIHQEMLMMSGDAGNGLPRVLFNGVIKIPKVYKRMGPSDKLQVMIIAKSVQADFCLQCHYKEFR